MSRPSGFAAAASLLLAVTTVARYCGPAAEEGLWATLLFSLVALTAAGSGRVFAGFLNLADVSDSQKTLIGASLGLGVLSLGSFMLAACGLLNLWAVILLLSLLWVVGFTEMRPMLASLAADRNLLRERPLASVAIFLPLLLCFWMTWVPPHQYDSLVYHLALPQAYVRAGGFSYPPHLIFSHFPQNGEMLFALALVLKSDLMAQMLMWLATALSLCWIFEMGKREAPMNAVLLSCLLLATHTSAMLLSATTYVEPLAMLWSTAAVFSYLRWRQLSPGAGPRSWLCLSALFTGLALGTKYYAGATAALLAVPLAAAALRAHRAQRRAAAADLGVFVGIVTALFIPWLAKNFLAVGNPVFPFFYRWFPMTRTGWSSRSSEAYFHVFTEYGHVGSLGKDLLLLPLRLLTNDPRFGGGADVLGGLGWEAVFWLLPVGIWAGWKNQFLRGLSWFCLAYFGVWFFTAEVLRFLAAILPLLCLLAGSGLHKLWDGLEAWGRRALASAMGFFIGAHLFLFGYVEAGLLRVPELLFGLQSREEFLSRRLDYYPCARRADSAGNGGAVLVVGEQRGYYVKGEHEAATVNAPNRYLSWGAEASDPAALARRIRGEGFSTVLYVPREAARLAPALGPASARAARNWAGLDQYLEPVFQGPACALYKVKVL
ncbi:MAG: hypothetical protein HY921_05385 [Elusimicrobia bacterium]|nr:hypothetical protein [Elusimicrobiota bacterium]